MSHASIALEGMFPPVTTFGIATLGYGFDEVIVPVQKPAIVLSFPKFDLPPRRYKYKDDIKFAVFGFDNVSYVDFRKRRQKDEDELLSQFLLGQTHNKYKKESQDDILQMFMQLQLSLHHAENNRRLQEDEILKFFIENILGE